MEENKNVASENISPKKQKKLEKIEAKLAQKREKSRKTIILDSFGKHIMKTFIVIAFVAVLVPFGVVTLSQKHGEEDVAAASAVEYATNAFEKTKPSKISYSYKSGVYNNSEEFTFSGDTLVERVSIEGDTKTIMRKPTVADKTYIQRLDPTKIDDAAVADYVNNNTTDYLFIIYTKDAGGAWVEDASATSLDESNYTAFVSKGTDYASVIAKISGITEYTESNVTKATAETKYNLFGLGYTYENYTIYVGNNNVVFDGNTIVEVYDFATLTRYTVNITL